MVVRISLDSSCLNIWHQHRILNKLRKLEEQRKIEVFSSGTVWREQIRPEIKDPYRERYQKRLEETKPISETTIFPFSFKGGVRFVTEESQRKIGQIAKICFPNKSWSELTENEKNDVRALEAHAYAGLDYFLTLNENDFIINGKKERLEEMGILVREPNDAFIKDLEMLFSAGMKTMLRIL